jgi:hypothetical protein
MIRDAICVVRQRDTMAPPRPAFLKWGMRIHVCLIVELTDRSRLQQSRDGERRGSRRASLRWQISQQLGD